MPRMIKWRNGCSSNYEEGRSFLQVVEVVADRAAVGAGDLILIEGALSLRLGGFGCFLELNGALAGDANALES